MTMSTKGGGSDGDGTDMVVGIGGEIEIEHGGEVDEGGAEVGVGIGVVGGAEGAGIVVMKGGVEADGGAGVVGGTDRIGVGGKGRGEGKVIIGGRRGVRMRMKRNLTRMIWMMISITKKWMTKTR